jgi:hypothetical protein
MTTLLIAIFLAALPPSESKDSVPVPQAEAKDAEREKSEAAERLVFMKDSLKLYEFQFESKGPAIILQTEPLLRWNNPVSGVRDGTVFIWTAAGRPQAAVQVFQLKGGLWLHEFQSLATERFEAKLTDGSPVWTPARAGIEMKPAPDAPAPAETERQRLAQMRAIAEEYQAIDDFEAKKSRWQLRLLSKPIARYAVPDKGIIDGALLAFAHGTDPEVFLLLEAHRTDRGAEWRIGMAPMTAYAVEVSRKDKPVWNAHYRESPKDPREPLFIRVYKP